MILYHGTRNSQRVIRHGFEESRTGEFGPGIYLTNNIDTARAYARRSHGSGEPEIIQVDVQIEKPFIVNKVDYIRMTERSTPRTIRARLIRKGHDAIEGIGINGYERQYVLFTDSGVKTIWREE